MPERFIQLLKDKNIFYGCELKDHPDTCCSKITTDVLNFDKTKELFCNEIKIGHCCSVDALYLSMDKSKLYLIEMKKKNSTKNINDYIANYFKTKETPKKIIESIILILGIIGYYDIGKTFYNYILDKNKVRMKAIFLCDCTERELTLLTISSLDQRDFNHTDIINGKVGVYNCQSIQTFFVNN